MQGGTLAGDRYQLRRATMVDLISTAYKVDANKVFGGPSWLDYDRFEVVAKTKPGTRPATLRMMLQTLLAERFHLVVKTDTQQVPGYILSTGKGSLNFKPATDDSGSTGCQNNFLRADGVSYQNFQCRNIAMADFAAFLQGPVGGPILDSTGLDGTWDIDLKYPIASLGAAFPGMDALQKLGLKLDPGKVPQSVLTVESVEEQPSANPSEVAAALPPLPAPAFEVASIRPCADNMSRNAQFQPGGRITAICENPVIMIMQAWKLPLSLDIPGMPKALKDTPNISIVAKAPADAAPDGDTLNAMMRALLIDRFKMAVHYEDRPVDAYTLVAVKPKLMKADPAGRTGCARQVEIHPGQGAGIHLECKNMTMAQWAEQIPAYKVDVHYPIMDSTGIDGTWDFTLDYNTCPGFAGRGRGPAGPTDAGVGEAPEPSGSVCFADAIQKQLGLKLEVHKRPEPVFVIDHMEEKPTDN